MSKPQGYTLKVKIKNSEKLQFGETENKIQLVTISTCTLLFFILEVTPSTQPLYPNPHDQTEVPMPPPPPIGFEGQSKYIVQVTSSLTFIPERFLSPSAATGL